jgi:DNA-binding response OmpR family regulator
MSDDFHTRGPAVAERTRALGRDLDEVTAADRQRVLVVEDEADTVLLLKNILRMAGFDVLSAMDGQEALRKYKEQAPDIVLLDLMMPEMDGWETLRYLREMSDVPVIIISAIGSKEDIVRALKIGVDDYMTKPFFNAEVVARIQAVMRRAGKQHPITHLVFPKIQLAIDLTSQEVTYHGETIHLTPKEFAVLTVLAKQAPAIVGYSKISTAVWGEDSDDARKRTKYLIYLLRRKFEKIQAGSDFIQNIDRLGYKFQSEP